MLSGACGDDRASRGGIRVLEATSMGRGWAAKRPARLAANGLVGDVQGS